MQHNNGLDERAVHEAVYKNIKEYYYGNLDFKDHSIEVIWFQLTMGKNLGFSKGEILYMPNGLGLGTYAELEIERGEDSLTIKQYDPKDSVKNIRCTFRLKQMLSDEGVPLDHILEGTLEGNPIATIKGRSLKKADVMIELLSSAPRYH